MKRLLVIALLVCAGVASGQWLERSLLLSDSLSHIAYSTRVLYNPANHHAYVGGGPNAELLHVFDYETRQKVGLINLPDRFTEMFLCADRQRMYALGEGPYVYAVDIEAETTVSCISVEPAPVCGVYNPQVHKAYIGTWQDAALFVYDPGPDTLLKTTYLSDEVIRIAYDSAANRLYCMAYDGSTHGIKVIDCAGDTQVGVLPTMDDYCVDIAFNPVTRRLYCLGQSLSTELAEVWAYDVDALTLLDTIALPESWSGIYEGRLLVRPATNRLYAATLPGFRRGGRDWPYDSIVVVDCGTNAITGFVGLPEETGVMGMSLNPVDDKVYAWAMDMDSMPVIGAADSITNWIPVGAWTTCVGWNPANGELLVPANDDFLNVVSGANDSILARVDYRGFYPVSSRWVPTGDKLYVFGNGVFVVDSTNNVSKRVWGPVPSAFEPAWSEELNHLYFDDAYGRCAYVFDCAGDSVLKTLDIRAARGCSPFFVPASHKLYWPISQQTLLVYDTYSDSVVATKTGFGARFVSNPRNGLCYGTDATAPDIRVIDPVLDSVIAHIPADYVAGLAINTTDNELYFTSWPDLQSVFVVDCSTNTVTDTIVTPGRPGDLYWSERLNKLYAFGDNSVMAFDCPTRSLSKVIPVGHERASDAVLVEPNDKLWVRCGDAVYVIQCVADSVVWSYQHPQSMLYGLEWNPVNNRVYVATGQSLYIFRDDMSGVETGTGVALSGIELRPRSNPSAGAVVFNCAVPGAQPGRLTVFDAAGRVAWNAAVPAGRRTQVTWPRAAGSVTAGVYFARLDAGSSSTSVKVIVE